MSHSILHVTASDCELNRLEIEKKISENDDNIRLVYPPKTKSLVWQKFRVIYYRGVRQAFVTCIECKIILGYKSRTGTAALLRHRCENYLRKLNIKYEYNQQAGNQSYDGNTTGGIHDNSFIGPSTSASQNNSSVAEYDLTSMLVRNELMLVDVKQEYDENMDEDYKNATNSDYFDPSGFENPEVLMKIPHENNGPLEELGLCTGGTGDFGKEHSREDLELLVKMGDAGLVFRRPENVRNVATWTNYSLIYHNNVRQNFVQCTLCDQIISYKKKTGTASLIRHRCKGINVTGNSTTGTHDNLSLTRCVTSTPRTYSNSNKSNNNNNNNNSCGGGGNATSGTAINSTMLMDTSSMGNLTTNQNQNDTINFNSLTAFLTKMNTINHEDRRKARSNLIPENIQNNIIKQQIGMVCKSLHSIELFSDKYFCNLLNLFLQFGAENGNQIQLNNILLYDNTRLLNNYLFNLYSEIKDTIKEMLNRYNFSLEYNYWTKDSEDKFLTLYCYTLNDNFEYRKLILATRQCDMNANDKSILTEILNEFIIMDNLERHYKNILFVKTTNCLQTEMLMDEECIVDCTIDQLHTILNPIIQDNYELLKRIIKIIATSDCKVDSLENMDISFVTIYTILDKYDKIDLTNLFVKTENQLKSEEADPADDGDNYYNIFNIVSQADINNLFEIFRQFYDVFRNLLVDDKATLHEVYLWKIKLEKICQPAVNNSAFLQKVKQQLLELLELNFIINNYHKIALFWDPTFRSLKFLSDKERVNVMKMIKDKLMISYYKIK